jgi:hypothetical protein
LRGSRQAISAARLALGTGFLGTGALASGNGRSEIGLQPNGRVEVGDRSIMVTHAQIQSATIAKWDWAIRLQPNRFSEICNGAVALALLFEGKTTIVEVVRYGHVEPYRFAKICNSEIIFTFLEISEAARSA